MNTKKSLVFIAPLAGLLAGALNSQVASAASCPPFTVPTAPVNCSITGVGNTSVEVISQNGATKTDWKYRVNFFAGLSTDGQPLKADSNVAPRRNSNGTQGAPCPPAVDNSKDGNFGGDSFCKTFPTGDSRAFVKIRVSIF